MHCFFLFLLLFFRYSSGIEELFYLPLALTSMLVAAKFSAMM